MPNLVLTLFKVPEQNNIVSHGAKVTVEHLEALVNSFLFAAVRVQSWKKGRNNIDLVRKQIEKVTDSEAPELFGFLPDDEVEKKEEERKRKY